MMKSLLLAFMVLAAGCHPVTENPAASGATSGRSPGAGKHTAVYPVASRRPMPDTPFTTKGGDSITLQDFAGRIVVLHLWATWCQPCVHEMPLLDRLVADMPSVKIVPVSVDIQADKAATFLAQQGLQHLSLYHDPDGQLMREMGAHALPMSFVMDRQGRIAAVIKGAGEWNSESLRTLLAGI